MDESLRTRRPRQRKDHVEAVADSVHVVGEAYLGPVDARDLLGDGEPEAAAVVMGAEQAMEALEHAGALGRWDRWTVVAHAHGGPRLRAHANGDVPAALTVAHRVVEQVVEQLAQPLGVAVDDHR